MFSLLWRSCVIFQAAVNVETRQFARIPIDVFGCRLPRPVAMTFGPWHRVQRCRYVPVWVETLTTLPVTTMYEY